MKLVKFTTFGHDDKSKREPVWVNPLRVNNVQAEKTWILDVLTPVTSIRFDRQWVPVFEAVDVVVSALDGAAQ